MNGWEIYTLSDPRTQQVRYVGTTRYPNLRLRQHIYMARRGHDFPVCRWILALLSVGLLPVYDVIEVGMSGNGLEAEERWIKFHRMRGDLTNVALMSNSQKKNYTMTEKQRSRFARRAFRRAMKKPREAEPVTP